MCIRDRGIGEYLEEMVDVFGRTLVIVSHFLDNVADKNRTLHKIPPKFTFFYHYILSG